MVMNWLRLPWVDACFRPTLLFRRSLNTGSKEKNEGVAGTRRFVINCLNRCDKSVKSGEGQTKKQTTTKEKTESARFFAERNNGMKHY